MSKSPTSYKWFRQLTEMVKPGVIARGYKGAYPRQIYHDGQNKMVSVPYTIKGTSVSSHAIKKFASGEWTPSQKTVTKLKNFYRRYTYNTLRKSGIDRKYARRRSMQDMKKTQIQARDMKKLVMKIAMEKAVDPKAILWGMSLTGRTPSEWDAYAKVKIQGDSPDDTFDPAYDYDFDIEDVDDDGEYW